MIDGLGFYIGNFLVAYYGLMIVIGLMAAGFVAWRQVKRYQKDFNDFMIIAATGGLFGIIGAKLLYLIVSFDQIDFTRLTDAAYVNDLMTGGFVFYGGLIGGLAGLLFCRKIFHLDVGSYLKIAVPCLPVVHGFGRIGCSIVGCCYGSGYHGIGAVTYHHSLFAPNNIPLFPVQAVEAALNLIIAAVLLVYINRYEKTNGLELYLILYAVMRFFLEFFRNDNTERGIYLGISTSQYISLIIIAAVLIFHRLNRKTERLNNNSL